MGEAPHFSKFQLLQGICLYQGGTTRRFAVSWCTTLNEAVQYITITIFPRWLKLVINLCLVVTSNNVTSLGPLTGITLL